MFVEIEGALLYTLKEYPSILHRNPQGQHLLDLKSLKHKVIAIRFPYLMYDSDWEMLGTKLMSGYLKLTHKLRQRNIR